MGKGKSVKIHIIRYESQWKQLFPEPDPTINVDEPAPESADSNSDDD